MILNHDAGITNAVPHPSISSPILGNYLSKSLISSSALEHFLNMVKIILTSSPGIYFFV